MVASVGAERYDLPHTSCPLCIRKGSRGLTVGSPPRRPARRRAGPAAGRPVLRPAARRLRRRGDQGRGPGHRRPDAPVGPGEAARQVAVVAGGRPQQEVGHLRTCAPPRARTSSAGSIAERRRRWSRTSGPARWSAGAWAPRRSGGTNPGLVITRVTGFGQTGPYAARAGLRLDRRGDGRHPLRHGRPRPAAGPRRHLHRRLARRDVRLPRHAGRRCTSAGAPAAARSSTRPSTRPCWP